MTKTAAQGQGQGQQAPQFAQPAPLTWRQKAGYIGTGIVIGVVIYPFVRKTVARVQPNLDKLFDALTGKAEGVAEMASDLIAKAKQSLRDEAAAAAGKGGETTGGVTFEKADAPGGAHAHGPGCDHDH